MANSNPEDAYDEQGSLTGGEAATLLAMICNVEPEEVRGWALFVHVHPKNSDEHHTRIATPMGHEHVIHLVMEGLGL